MALSLQEYVLSPPDEDLRIFKVPAPKPLDVVVEAVFSTTPDVELILPSGSPVLRCHTLPWREAPLLLSELARLGVSAASVFPGYDGVVQSLRELGISSP